mgnify:CR=1 FL=1
MGNMKSQDNQREAVFLSYLAGIIDGEGTIRIGSSKPTNKINWNTIYYAAISVGMTNRKIIEMFVKKFGSKIREEKCVANRKKMYRWGTSGNFVVPTILKQLLPYLVVKKEQAELVIKYCSKVKTTGFRRNKKLPINQLLWREDFYQKMKKLNS